MPVYRINVVHELHGSQCLNSWYAEAAAFPSDAELQDFVDNMVEGYWDQVSPDLNFLRLDVRRVDIVSALTVPFYPDGWPKAGGGTVGAGAVPSFCAVLIKGISADGVPPGRIRKFIPGVTESDVADSILTPAGLTAWESIVDTMQTWIDSDPTLRPVAVKYEGEPPVVTGWNDIETMGLSEVIAIMSSRKKGRGV